MNNPTIILFYKYVAITDPHALKAEQIAWCTELGLKGRVIVAHEGINATLEGPQDAIEEYLRRYLADARFSDTHIKKSQGTGDAFPKLSVKVRPEIVSLHLTEDFSPTETTGKRLSADELKKWYEEGREFYIIDMRNDYEHAVGRFKDSILPNIKNFRDVPKVLDDLAPLRGKTVVPVCTGGVRCEKASGFLVKNGFEDVYQLDGGIVTYIEKFPAQEFEGTLYVFDRRVTMDFDPPEKHTVVGTCLLCGTASERYVNCKNPRCNKHFISCDQCADGGCFCSDGCAAVMSEAVSNSTT